MDSWDGTSSISVSSPGTAVFTFIYSKLSGAATWLDISMGESTGARGGEPTEEERSGEFAVVDVI